jgi:hypothetical protein
MHFEVGMVPLGLSDPGNRVNERNGPMIAGEFEGSHNRLAIIDEVPANIQRSHQFSDGRRIEGRHATLAGLASPCGEIAC